MWRRVGRALLLVEFVLRSPAGLAGAGLAGAESPTTPAAPSTTPAVGPHADPVPPTPRGDPAPVAYPVNAGAGLAVWPAALVFAAVVG